VDDANCCPTFVLSSRIRISATALATDSRGLQYGANVNLELLQERALGQKRNDASPQAAMDRVTREVTAILQNPSFNPAQKAKRVQHYWDQ
jgi:hypothetical protein